MTFRLLLKALSWLSGAEKNPILKYGCCGICVLFTTLVTAVLKGLCPWQP